MTAEQIQTFVRHRRRVHIGDPSIKVEATTAISKEEAYALAFEIMAAADKLWGWTPERCGF